MSIRDEFNVMMSAARYAYPGGVEDKEELEDFKNFIWSFIEDRMKQSFIDGFTEGVYDLHQSSLDEGFIPPTLEEVGIRSCGEEKYEEWWNKLGIARYQVKTGGV